MITNVEECGLCPFFASFTLAICFTTEEKARKNLSQGKKNLSQSTVRVNVSNQTIGATYNYFSI
jgi:hypothetical protein